MYKLLTVIAVFIAINFYYKAPEPVDTVIQYSPSDSSLFQEKDIQLCAPSAPYLSTVEDIGILRKKTRNKSQDSIAYYFTESILNQIIPYWYGTKWSFEGHSAVPGKGEIACGYFVSTTLRDVGIPLNRYTLAQQGPEDEAEMLAYNEPILLIEHSDGIERLQRLRSAVKEGISFIGLDRQHVGFILKRKGNLFFIHSNYVNSSGVMIEPAIESEVLLSYEKYFVVSLSHNRSLMRKWVKN